MKKLDIFEKFIIIINSVIAIVLLAIYVIPFLDPEQFSFFSVLSLTYPAVLILNILFVLYWISKLKLQFLLSLICIGIGYKYFNAFITFENKEVLLTDDIKILSYNVRGHNIYNWIDSPTIKQDIVDFIQEQKADVICIQEYKNIKNTPQYLPYIHHHPLTGMVTFSKYPIVDTKSFNFEGTRNNVIRTDLLIQGDTISNYNVHFQSFMLDSTNKNKKKSVSDLKVLFNKTFEKQAKQVKLVKKDIELNKHRTFIVGDFNNTAFSWHYHQLIENKKDAFIEAGNGLGTTFNYIAPLRIDFMLIDETIKINQFKKFNIKLSDHYPIFSRINIRK